MTPKMVPSINPEAHGSLSPLTAPRVNNSLTKSTYMTLDAPQWPTHGQPAAMNATKVKEGVIVENGNKVTWNGAEQLFAAAKAYGIRCCFANPGTSNGDSP